MGEGEAHFNNPEKGKWHDLVLSQELIGKKFSLSIEFSETYPYIGTYKAFFDCRHGYEEGDDEEMTLPAQKGTVTVQITGYSDKHECVDFIVTENQDINPFLFPKEGLSGTILGSTLYPEEFRDHYGISDIDTKTLLKGVVVANGHDLIISFTSAEGGGYIRAPRLITLPKEISS